jgi:hypothetical protein
MQIFLRNASLSFAALSAIILMAACSTTNRLSADVARFHRLPAPAGQTFRVVPADDTKKNSIEFDSYAALVTSQLVQAGFRPAEANSTSLYDVRLDYMISNGQEKIATRPGFYTGYNQPIYYSRHHGRYGYNDAFYEPFYNNGFTQSDVYSYTLYTRKLQLDIVKTAGGEKLFEGRVESLGSDNRLPELMPYLVQAMFNGFPGSSGITQHVNIDIKRP